MLKKLKQNLFSLAFEITCKWSFSPQDPAWHSFSTLSKSWYTVRVRLGEEKSYGKKDYDNSNVINVFGGRFIIGSVIIICVWGKDYE